MARGALANVIIFVAVVLPLVLDPKYAGRFTIVVITAMVGVSLVILTGWAGQISLGQFGFAGLGALLAGGLGSRGVDFFVCLAVAGLAGAIGAVLIGLPALRIQGPFLAVTTLAFAFTVQHFFLNPSYFDWLLPETGEFADRPLLYGFFSTRSDIRFYFVCLTFLVLSLLGARSLRRNRMGRILIGIRDNPRAVQAYGVNLARAKLAAFALSGFIAATAGGLFTFYLGSVSANTFTPERSVAVFTITVIGGLTSLPGAVLGAIVIEGIPFLFDGDETVRLLTSSVGLLALLLFVPGGLSELLYRTRDRFLRFAAARNGLHVPSLVADSLVRGQDQPADVVSGAAEQVEHAGEAEEPDDDLLGCPVCGLRIPLDEARNHPHFAVPAGKEVAVTP